MNQIAREEFEKLIRIRAERRGRPVEIRVHYSASFDKGCTVYSILSMEDPD